MSTKKTNPPSKRWVKVQSWGKIPLEMAVKPGSLFPKHLLYLLAPSYQVGGWRIFLGGRVGCCDTSFGERLVIYLGGMHPKMHRFVTLAIWFGKRKMIRWYWGNDLEPGVMYFPTKWGAVQNLRILKITGNTHMFDDFCWRICQNLPLLAWNFCKIPKSDFLFSKTLRTWQWEIKQTQLAGENAHRW